MFTTEMKASSLNNFSKWSTDKVLHNQRSYRQNSQVVDYHYETKYIVSPLLIFESQG